MADEGGDGERTSFVNETFDELDSEPSGDVLLSSDVVNEEREENEKREEKEEERDDDEKRHRENSKGEELLASPQNHEYAYLEDIQLNKETTLPIHQYDMPTKSDMPTDHNYEIPILPYYDEPIITDTKPHLPSRPPPRLVSQDTPILSFDNMSSASPRSGASLASSKVVAHSNGNHDDDTNHRPLPFPSSRKYDTIGGDTLRGNTDDFDLQVN